MATGKGVIQGYTGVAAVDSAHQIIVEAQAHGTGSEQELLLPVVTAMRHLLTDHSFITADAGYHSEANLQQLASLQVDALIADKGMRQRDARFATQERHQQAPDPLYDKSRPEPRQAGVYQPRDFSYDAAARTCVCPAGKSLYRKGSAIVTNGYVCAIPGDAPRLSPLYATRALSPHTGHDPSTSRGILPREGRRLHARAAARESHEPDRRAPGRLASQLNRIGLAAHDRQRKTLARPTTPSLPDRARDPREKRGFSTPSTGQRPATAGSVDAFH